MTRLALALLLTLLMVACGGPSPTQPPVTPTGVITGTLTDGQGAPVADAQVVLGDATSLAAGQALAPAAAAMTTTNAHGQFALDVDEEGEYTLTVLLDHEGAHARVTVIRDASGRLTSQPLAMSTAPLGAVSGTVAGKGAGAWAFLLGTSFLATTDADGSFLISRVPAGTYRLAAGALGAVGPATEVTVGAGEVTNVTEPLEFGPVITSVEPAGLVPVTTSFADDAETHEVRLRGRGFGDSMGVSRVLYAGRDISDHVMAWSENEIVLASEWVLYPGHTRPVAEDDLHYSVATTSGEATSEVAGYWYAQVGGNQDCRPGHYPEGWFAVTVSVSSRVVTDLTLDLEVFHATARSSESGAEVHELITGPSGCAAAYLDSDGKLPVVVQVGIDGHKHDPNLLLNPPGILVAPFTAVAGTNRVTGLITTHDGLEPMTDDGHFTARIWDWCEDRFGPAAPVHIDDTGTFTTDIDIPDPGDCNTTVYFFYRGAEFHQESLSTEPQAPEPAPVDLFIEFTGTSGGGSVQQAELGIDCVYDPGVGATGTCQASGASTAVEYTFVATPAADSTFSHWEAGGALCPYETTCAITPNFNPFIIRAVFVALPD